MSGTREAGACAPEAVDISGCHVCGMYAFVKLGENKHFLGRLDSVHSTAFHLPPRLSVAFMQMARHKLD